MTPNTIEAPDRQAVEQIDVWAQFERGEAAASAGDHVQAVKWWRLSAERGCAEAQHQLGRAFSEGKGVPQDHVKACMWLTLSWQSKERPRVFFNPSSDELRNAIERYMTPAQVTEAQGLVREWAAARVA